LIEENEEIIDDYHEERSFIICGDPKEVKSLEQIKIKEIDCVINMESDVKNSVLITRRLRELNKNCKIISRVFLESVAEILESPPFVSEVISSSKGTLETMIKKGMLKF
jgi:Trk K+ transport system NAD-binding subunit